MVNHLAGCLHRRRSSCRLDARPATALTTNTTTTTEAPALVDEASTAAAHHQADCATHGDYDRREVASRQQASINELGSSFLGASGFFIHSFIHSFYVLEENSYSLQI